jgi:methyl-accepting chemotaxis protein
LAGEVSSVVAQMAQSMAQASSSLAEATTTAEELRPAACVIDASSSQQFTGIDQVVQAMINIEQVMQQLVGVSGELKHSARQLSDLGNDLNPLVQQYQMEKAVR